MSGPREGQSFCHFSPSNTAETIGGIPWAVFPRQIPIPPWPEEGEGGEFLAEEEGARAGQAGVGVDRRRRRIGGARSAVAGQQGAELEEDEGCPCHENVRHRFAFSPSHGRGWGGGDRGTPPPGAPPGLFPPAPGCSSWGPFSPVQRPRLPAGARDWARRPGGKARFIAQGGE